MTLNAAPFARVHCGAVFIFGYCALVLVDAWMFQWRLARELERCIPAAEMPNERPGHHWHSSCTVLVQCGIRYIACTSRASAARD